MSIEIYQASTENLRDLKKERKRINVLANRAIRENNIADLSCLTKIYALLYSAYAEVALTKLIHAPNALNDSEISQINTKNNLEEKWIKCVDLAISKLNTNGNKGEIANKKQTLIRLMQKNILQPSILRNRVAHGQWKICLNNDCTSINKTVTDNLEQLDFVRVDSLFYLYDIYSQCILDLLVSTKTHYRDYYALIATLEEKAQEFDKWTIETKRNKLISSEKNKRFSKRKSSV